MDRTTLTVTGKAEKRIRAGHPWVFDTEVSLSGQAPENGDFVDVCTQKGKWLGTGFYNNHSKIRVRLLTRNPNDARSIQEDFWRRRISYAIDYRAQVMQQDFAACRLVFGEADQLPGLTVDRYADVLVTQIACLGMEQRKEMLYTLLMEKLRSLGQEIHCIYERNDLPLREKEGLAPGKGFVNLPGLSTGSGHVEICENGIYYDVDYIQGQKTGFFLDQKYNRAAVARLCRGLRVLDLFTHTGSFGLCAAAAGAAQVTSVDVSQTALDQARKNAERNGLFDRIEYIRSDAFDYLDAQKRGDFEVIIVDPPAFTKSASTLTSALRGYRELNEKAIRLLHRGGILCTCSCSHFLTDARFHEVLADAAKAAQVTLRQIESRRQSPDHPILWQVPETEYLQFYIFQII